MAKFIAQLSAMGFVIKLCMHEPPPTHGQAERWKLEIKDQIYLYG